MYRVGNERQTRKIGDLDPVALSRLQSLGYDYENSTGYDKARMT